jgi:hypothetical protein
VYLNILGSFLKLKKVHSLPQKFLQKKGGKTYLIWHMGRGGVSESLNKKKSTWVVFKFLGPPWMASPQLWANSIGLASSEQLRAIFDRLSA